MGIWSTGALSDDFCGLVFDLKLNGVGPICGGREFSLIQKICGDVGDGVLCLYFSCLFHVHSHCDCRDGGSVPFSENALCVCPFLLGSFGSFNYYKHHSN